MSLLIAPGIPALFVMKFFLHQAALLEAAELSALLRQRPLRVRCGTTWMSRGTIELPQPQPHFKCDDGLNPKSE